MQLHRPVPVPGIPRVGRPESRPVNRHAPRAARRTPSWRTGARAKKREGRGRGRGGVSIRMLLASLPERALHAPREIRPVGPDGLGDAPRPFRDNRRVRGHRGRASPLARYLQPEHPGVLRLWGLWGIPSHFGGSLRRIRGFWVDIPRYFSPTNHQNTVLGSFSDLDPSGI